jgi:hypothetical protein
MQHQKTKPQPLPDGSIHFGKAVICATSTGDWIAPGRRVITDRATAVEVARRMHRMMCKE